jgi:predicted phosphohydrolase
MRIIVTSDLHYNVARSKAPTEHTAREVCRLGGDALVFLGDSAAADLSVLEEVFGLFETFPGTRLAVAGNHELWTAGQEDSLARYEKKLAEVCSRCGVHYLDAEPYLRGGVAIVGNVGWYDFTFRPSLMKIPLRFYQHKVAPGAAAHIEKYRHLLEGQDDVPPAALDITTRWMDGEQVNLPMGDVEFTHLVAARLRHHLEQVHDSAEHIVVGIHHLPFAELVSHSVIPNWEFATAFMGSELLGETLLDFPKVGHLYCGHSHRSRRFRKHQMLCTSIGSTYREKRYEVLDL